MSIGQMMPMESDLHDHLADDHYCPWCDQPITSEKLDEIQARIRSEERQRTEAIHRQLQADFAQEKAETHAKAKAEVDAARSAASLAVETARREAAAKEADVLAKTAAEVERIKQEAVAKELAAREEAKRTAELALAANIAAAEAAKQSAEKRAAESQAKHESEATARRQEKLEAAEREAALVAAAAADVEKLKKEAAAKELVARDEATRIAQAASAAKVLAAEEARRAAEEAKQAVEAKALEVQTNHQAELMGQREILEKAGTDAVNVAKAKALEEKLKIEERVTDLQRQLQKKTPDELGDGAELDLYEELRSAFEGDDISRVKKGTAGADIIHKVMRNGTVCGQIVYDSKNRNAWKNDYVTKLRDDQIAAEADHSVLSSNKFPAGAAQLHLQEGVIVATPARVVALAELLRNHVLQTYELRISGKEREAKTSALYDFITSERCGQLLGSIETRTNKVLDLDVAEKKAHDALWNKRGTMLRSVLKAHADLRFEVDRIIGTAGEDEEL
jgi:hypothetical protein